MTFRKKLTLRTLMLSFCVCIFGSNAVAMEVLSNTPPAKMAFETTPEGVGFAPLVGDRFKESYMAMVRLPAGLVSPPHTKSATMYGVLISGEMVHHRIDTDPASHVLLPAGSFYKIPANIPHISRCVSKIECVTFLYQDGKFDFKPVAKQ